MRKECITLVQIRIVYVGVCLGTWIQDKPASNTSWKESRGKNDFNDYNMVTLQKYWFDQTMPNHFKSIQIYCIYVRWQKPCRQQLTALQNRQRVWVLHHHCEPGTRWAEMGRASHARTRPRRAAHVPRHCVFCRSCTSDFLGADKKYRHRPSTSSGWNSGKS